jgi:hypothetical protein
MKTTENFEARGNASLILGSTMCISILENKINITG